MIGDTLERIVPDLIGESDTTARQSLQLHLERYQFASRHLKPGRLLDIACGSGYGTHLLLSENFPVITSVVAVDNDEEIIAYAKKRYPDPKVDFISQDAMNFKDPAGFTTIVSLETIEHLREPERFLEHLYSLLLPGGRLIISAPVTPSKDANPYHLHDFTSRSFRKMLNKFTWQEKDSMLQKQPYSIRELRALNSGKQKIRKNLIRYYFQHPGAAATRLISLLRDGLRNKYLVVVLQKK